MSILVASDLTFVDGARIGGLPLATAPGQPATYEQIGGGGGSTPIESVDLLLGMQTQSHEQTVVRLGTLPTQNVRCWLASSIDSDLWQLENVSIAAECQVDSVIFYLSSVYFESGIITVKYQVL